MTPLPTYKDLPPVDADRVIAAVALAFSVPVEALQGRSRARRLVQARCLASWLLRHRVPRSGIQRSYPVIGRLLGGADHSTVIHRLNRAEGWAQSDPVFGALLRELATRDPILPAAMPVQRLSAAQLTGIDHTTRKAVAEARRGVHRRAVEAAISGSRSKRGAVIDDDRDARNRASASILLLAAIVEARAAA